MAIKRTYNNKNTFYFTTFTCIKWLPLIELSNAYDSFYKWFAYLKSTKIPLIAYVIMPNHFHALIYLPDYYKHSINQLLANAKRFIAYDIISGLKNSNNVPVLSRIKQLTNAEERKNGKIHRVFKTSSDIKEIYSKPLLRFKINYIHRNPTAGKWSLSKTYRDYPHTSARFYELNEENPWIMDYRLIS